MRSSLILLCFSIFIISCQSNRHAQGERLYVNYCAPCHGAQGEGLKELYPPLKDADYYMENMENLACIIRNGLEDRILVNGKPFQQKMTGIKTLGEVEICNLINYMNHLWYPNEPYLSLELTKRMLEACDKG
jgi:cytochrome c